MQKLAALLMTSFLAVPAAFATWIVPVSATICTRDYNAWGKASICDCPHATRYENRIGQCVQGAPIDISVEGFVAPELNLDGDTVGYILSKSETKSFQLVLPIALRAKFDEGLLEGIKFRISGEVIENFDGTEIVQPTIIVEKIEPLDLFSEDLILKLPLLPVAE